MHVVLDGPVSQGEQCGLFFFQAEDGIRDWSVTGVQTCALPISSLFSWTLPTPSVSRIAILLRASNSRSRSTASWSPAPSAVPSSSASVKSSWRAARSEERRVGKGGEAEWAPDELVVDYVRRKAV